MKFYSKRNKLIVWDKEMNKKLCQFEKGIFDTENERTIKILTESGYKCDSVVIDITPSKEVIEAPKGNLKYMNIRELKAFAKENNISGCSNLNKEELLKKLGGIA